jgi:signal transduction histidine kinase
LNDRGEHSIILSHEFQHMPVYLDPDILERVIDNLLSNAIKYSPHGTEIQMTIKTEDRCVLIEVSDQGIGIPERDLKFLFQPFQRGSNASDYPGTGIGLTIIQKSVELLNGTVSLKTKVGQGTTFWSGSLCDMKTHRIWCPPKKISFHTNYNATS